MSHHRITGSLTVAVLLSLMLTGCVSTLREKPYRYDMPSDKTRYSDLSQYTAVYALVESSGWSSRVTALVFDFKDDDVTLKPPAKAGQRNESWVKVQTREKLASAITEMDASTLDLITMRPCLGCDRSPVGAYFSSDFIQLTYAKADHSLEFKTIDAMALESGGGGDGGGDGG